MRKERILAAILIAVAFCSSPKLFGEPTELHSLGDPLLKQYGDQTLPVTPAESTQAMKEIQGLILNMAQRWNAQDIRGFMGALWESPDLVVINDGQCVHGWADTLAEFERGFHNPSEMGTLQYDSIQTQLLQPNLAVSVTNWTVHFKTRTVSGIGSETLFKFADGWKIVVNHDTVTTP